MNTYLVSMDWLKNHLSDPNVVIVDCRFVLGSPETGQEHYLAGHIPGAVYFDLEKDLSGPKAKHGGRHPLPNVDQLAEKLGRAGIDQSKHVVAYDDQGGAMASRFWWIMQYAGHAHTSILNGGFSHWNSLGYPTTTEVPDSKLVVFTPHIQEHMLVDMEYVKQKRDAQGTILIDSREANRYKGLEEHIDPVAGHVPGALNSFWKGVLNENGTWKSPDELKGLFHHVDPDKEVIVYCGSGVTACPNILGLKAAGYKNVKLYAGSWSDWSSYSDNPVATDK